MWPCCRTQNCLWVRKIMGLTFFKTGSWWSSSLLTVLNIFASSDKINVKQHFVIYFRNTNLPSQNGEIGACVYVRAAYMYVSVYVYSGLYISFYFCFRVSWKHQNTTHVVTSRHKRKISTVKHRPFYKISTVKHRPFYKISTVKHRPFYKISTVKHRPFYKISTVKHKPFYKISTVKHKPFK